MTRARCDPAAKRPASGMVAIGSRRSAVPDLRGCSRTHRYLHGRDVTTVPDIPVVQLPALDADGASVDGARTTPGSIWAVDVPHSRRLTPVMLTALGVLAGIAAMAVGTAAVIYAGSQSSTPAGVQPDASPAAAATVPAVERRALALLGKPSTERIAFRGRPGLVLAVGSAGRAAILIRSLPPATAGAKYNAWIVAPRAAPVGAARFVGTERAVFLTKRLRPGESVVVSTTRPVAGAPAGNRLVALRG
jgi:hypothetical protein